MGRAQDRWEALVEAWKAKDFGAIEEMYTKDCVYYEPFNPPHEGNLLVVAYLKDYLGSKEDLEITTKRFLEDEAEGRAAVEWSMSYTARGRRWNDLPRCSFVDVNEDGKITYHRDYS